MPAFVAAFLLLSSCASMEDALVAASRRGELERARRLVAEGADINRDTWSLTALHAAAGAGNGEIVEFLLANGARVDACDLYTPLCAAARGGHKDVAQLLIARGADVNTNPFWEDGKPTLTLHAGYHGTFRAYFSAGERIIGPPLHWAAWKGHTDVAAMLLDNGADINARGRYGLTALHWAAMGGHADLSEVLVARGAIVDAGALETPLHLAAAGGHRETVALFIAVGAKLNVRDHRGKTPLESAEARGHEGIAALLKAAAKERDQAAAPE